MQVAGDDFDLVWSQMPAARTTNYMDADVRKILGFQLPSVKNAVDHLLFIGRLNANEISSMGTARAVHSALYKVYAFLYINSIGEAHKNEIKKLCSKRAVLLSVQASSEPTFATGDQIFLQLDQDIAPFGYHASDTHTFLSTHFELLELMGAQKQPSVELIVAWLREMHSRNEGNELNPDELGLSQRLLNLLCTLSEETSPDLDLATLDIFVPDSNGTMQPARELCINDAPWVSARVDLALLRVLHPRVSLKVARRIGVRSIRHTVEEKLAAGFKPKNYSPVPEGLPGWQAALGSRQVQAGLMRVWEHEQDSSTLKTSSDIANAAAEAKVMKQRLSTLGNLDLVAVHGISSVFMESATGQDVTKQADGSLAIVDIESTKLLLVAHNVPEYMLLAKLALTLNQYLFAGTLNNLAPIEKMLQCHGDQVQQHAVPHVLASICCLPHVVGSNLRGFSAG